MKARTSHVMHTHIAALRLAETLARRTGERQRVELIRNRLRRTDHRWRVVPVEAPATDTSYDPTDYANGVTP